jgi:choice-of-anchor C domain-containing protein
MKSLSRILWCCLAVVAMVTPCGADILLVNGSFEDPSAIVISGYRQEDMGSLSITGWSVGGLSGSGGVDWIDSGPGNASTNWVAYEGNRSVDLNHDFQGAISQSFATVAGHAYDVSFALGGNFYTSFPGLIPDVKEVLVTLGRFSQVYGFDTVTKGSTYDDMKWTLVNFSFIASAGSSTISFESRTGTWHGPVIDAVNVTEQSTPVPLPAALFLIAPGFAGLVAARRRSRK